MMDGLDYLSIAVLAFFTGLGTSFGAELSKAIIVKLREVKKVA